MIRKLLIICLMVLTAVTGISADQLETVEAVGGKPVIEEAYAFPGLGRFKLKKNKGKVNTIVISESDEIFALDITFLDKKGNIYDEGHLYLREILFVGHSRLMPVWYLETNSSKYDGMIMFDVAEDLCTFSTLDNPIRFPITGSLAKAVSPKKMTNNRYETKDSKLVGTTWITEEYGYFETYGLLLNAIRFSNQVMTDFTEAESGKTMRR